MADSSDAQLMETTRLEAFSDGVFAVAITLLALNLAVPQVSELRPGHTLTTALLDQWPIYLAYSLSFLSILIMWINHHQLFRLIKRTDHLFLMLNGFLLMVVTVMPFATNLLSTYLEQPDKRVAIVIYSGLSLAMATTFNRMWSYASRDGRLLDAAADAQAVQDKTNQFRYGPAIYTVAFVLAFFSPDLSLAMCILLAVFFAFPSSVTQRRPARLPKP
jgi:uncharacterized membrane protein